MGGDKNGIPPPPLLAVAIIDLAIQLRASRPVRLLVVEAGRLVPDNWH
jgi:hypothetical protein